MKKLVLAMIAACTLSTASAQEQKNDGQRQRPRVDRTEMMVKEYGLDAKQTEKLKALNEQYKDLFRMGPGRGLGRGPGRGPGQGMGQNRQRPDGNSGASVQNQQRPSREEMEKMMKERKEKMDKYEAELKKIFSSEQYKKYESDRQKRMERGGFGRERNNGNKG
ncbi:MAG: DUF4890 domain-containing protein [Prevotella sp.]|nr:DUF4890 domain-containing protein [Prevotella sp.]